ncbi:MAG: head maturation protease, ClpP-related [Alphaproteobacteria bacterium]
MPMNKIDMPQRPDVDLRCPPINFASGRTFDVQNKGDVAEITLYEMIGKDFWSGEGIDSKTFKKTLDSITAKTINLKINSPGGFVFDGIAMYNDLVAHPAKINVTITGLAASAASFLAMAGDTITMAKNSFMMIHEAWSCACGNKNDMREVADFLEKIDEAIVDTYKDRTNLPNAQIREMMKVETWMTAEEAINLGFADDFSEEPDAKAAYDLSVFARAPKAMKQRVEASLREAGYSRTEATAAVNKGFQVLGPREADEHNNLRGQREAAEGLNTLRQTIQALTQEIEEAAA